MADLIQLRRDTKANWDAVSGSVILADGEVGIICDQSPLQCKVGDGVSYWNQLETQAFVESGSIDQLSGSVAELSGSVGNFNSVNAGSQPSLLSAATAVPPGLRKPGLILSYYSTEELEWALKRYVGTTVSGWNDENSWEDVSSGGGSGESGNYNELTNKPSINNVVLAGNKTPMQLGLATANQVETLSNKVDKLPTGYYYGKFSSVEDLPEATEKGYAYVASTDPTVFYTYLVSGAGAEWVDSGNKMVNTIDITTPKTVETELSKEEKYYASANVNDRPAYVVIETGVVKAFGYQVLSPNLSFAEQVTAANTIYEVKDEFDLNGGSVTIPAGCTLKFNGGAIKNGIIVGNNTLFKYDAPFIGDDMSFSSCKVTGNVYDTDVFINVNHTQYEIQTLISLSALGTYIHFSKGVYNNIDTIEITNNIDLNFNGSTLVCDVKEYTFSQTQSDNLPCPVFYMEPAEEGESSNVKSIKISNVIIDGTLDEAATYGINRCMQFFNVDNITLDNVRVTRYRCGSTSQYHPNWRERYELNVNSFMYYKNIKILNCEFDNCTNETNWLVPKVDATNYAEIANNTFHDLQHAGIRLIDGRCHFHHNYGCDCGDDCSLLHLAGYDSIVEYNTVENWGKNYLCNSDEGGYPCDNIIYRGNKMLSGLGLMFSFAGSNAVFEGNECHVQGGFLTITGTKNTPIHNETFANMTRDYISDDGNIIIRNNIVNAYYGVNQYNSTGYNINRVKNIVIKDCYFNFDVTVELAADKQHAGFTFNCKDILLKKNDIVNVPKYNTSSYCLLNISGSSGSITFEKNNIKDDTGHNIIFNYFTTSDPMSKHVIVDNTVNVTGRVFYSVLLITSEINFVGNTGFSINSRGISPAISRKAGNLNDMGLSLSDLEQPIAFIKNDILEEDGIQYLCIKTGVSAVNGAVSRSTVYESFSYLRYPDGSVWMSLGKATTASTIPTYAGAAIGDRITDGTLSLQKVANEEPDFVVVGTTVCTNATRPTKYLNTGRPVFDSTLGKPIFWSGMAWVDANGDYIVDNSGTLQNRLALTSPVKGQQFKLTGGVNDVYLIYGDYGWLKATDGTPWFDDSGTLNAMYDKYNYTLLTEQPSDWTTKYNTYYKIVNGVYTLLTTLETWASDTYYKKDVNVNKGIQVKLTDTDAELRNKVVKWNGTKYINIVDNVALKAGVPQITFTTENNNTTATITNTSSGKIYYTKNGDAPTSSSTEYNSAITLAEGDQVKAICIRDHVDNSNIGFVKVAKPVITFNDGILHIECDTPDAKIYYTTDGNPPSTSSTEYDSSASVTIAKNVTVKAFAVLIGRVNSDVASKKRS